ncbi:hypothetical protein EVAR_43558_1 [Eumeta japonica]|uniref:Mariner Mos1 transposase n=1 Tax=Eumeta variegata TaxID=151549 RepID=A0A4C1W8Z8_EUMVA|nr:hypothetical protein EVAR_43558_1 [Eumeta japonica]
MYLSSAIKTTNGASTFHDNGNKPNHGSITGDETWIYCYDPKTKQQPTVWIYGDEPKPIKVARERSASKRMIASCFNKIGHVATVALENYHTVNGDWYTTICLPYAIDELRKNNRCIILHHANANSHTAKQTN